MRGYGTVRAPRGHQRETITKPSLSSSPVPTQPTTLRNFGGTSSPAAYSSSGTNRPTPPPKPRAIASTLSTHHFRSLSLFVLFDWPIGAVFTGLMM